MQWFLAGLAAMVIRLLQLTWRVRVRGPAPDTAKPVVACFWHGEQAGMFAHPRTRPVVVLASLSKDGALQSRILRRLGFVVVRGSSSRRGAAGLKGVVDAMRQGADAAFAVDGPRGPLHQVKTGAILAAQQTGAILMPVTIRASRAWVFNRAWDRYALPKPFAEVVIARHKPILANSDSVDAVRERLQIALGHSVSIAAEKAEFHST